MIELKAAIIMLGPPGAGKGTQARLLSESFNFAHIATGDMLRVAIRDDTKEGRRAKTFIEAGQLVADEIVDSIVRERLDQPDGGRGFIFDGYPRTLPQAKTLQNIIEHDHALSLTIGINIADEILIGRLSGRWICPRCNKTFNERLSSGACKKGLVCDKCEDRCEEGLICDKCEVRLTQRVDDTIEVVTDRLKIYHEQTEPLIRYYQEQGRYVSIDGDQLPDKIFSAISGVVKEQMGSL